ncbi:hypothetical protein [Streptomyces sp. NPDC059575]|uniref:hypothetical protein n=1 Tax=Streptomyces sp. NPDC059575 TaxID=3346872 RepID=UPI003698C34C
MPRYARVGAGGHDPGEWGADPAVIAVPVAADCGEVVLTVGGVVLAVEVSRTASTQ